MHAYIRTYINTHRHLHTEKQIRSNLSEQTRTRRCFILRTFSNLNDDDGYVRFHFGSLFPGPHSSIAQTGGIRGTFGETNVPSNFQKQLVTSLVQNDRQFATDGYDENIAPLSRQQSLRIHSWNIQRIDGIFVPFGLEE